MSGEGGSLRTPLVETWQESGAVRANLNNGEWDVAGQAGRSDWMRPRGGSAIKPRKQQHAHEHGFVSLNAREREGLTIVSRRGMSKASFAGLGGLTLRGLLQTRSRATQAGRGPPGRQGWI